MTQYAGHRWCFADLMWLTILAVSLVAANVMRLSFMGLRYGYYEVIHGTLGNTIMNVIMLSLAVGFSAGGGINALSS